MLSVLIAAAVAAPHQSAATYSVWPAPSSSFQVHHVAADVPVVQAAAVADDSADVVISAAAAAAEPEHVHVGSLVEHVPIAVSHQSRTDYHSTPVVKSVLAPVEYVQPIVHVQHPQPAAHVVYTAEPIVHHIETKPLQFTVHSVPQYVRSAPVLLKSAHHLLLAGSQLVHSAPVEFVSHSW